MPDPADTARRHEGQIGAGPQERAECDCPSPNGCQKYGCAARQFKGQIGDLWLPANDPAPTWGERALTCSACACAAGIVALVLAWAFNAWVM